jgi:HEAT repeat protein
VTTRERLRSLAHDPNALHAWIAALLEAGDPRLPEVATWAAEQGDIELLVSLMDDYVVHCNTRTVEAIRATLPTTGEALGERIGRMLAHHAPEERRAGALFAGLLGLASLAPRLVAALEDPYFLTRMEAAVALGKLRYLPAVEPLRLALADEDILTRNAAIEALTQIPDPDLLTAYTGRFIDDPPEYHYGAFDDALPRARAHAIRVLRDHRPPCAREALSFYVHTWEEAEAEGDEVTAEDREVVELARSVLASFPASPP